MEKQSFNAGSGANALHAEQRNVTVTEVLQHTHQCRLVTKETGEFRNGPMTFAFTRGHRQSLEPFRPIRVQATGDADSIHGRIRYEKTF
jgi:hypothetical protein